MSFGRFVYTLILPSMMKTLGYSITLMGILGTGIVLGYLISSYGSARLARVIGAPSTIKLSILLISISLFCLGHFRHLSILLLAFVGLGAGAAGSYIPLIQIMNSSFGRKGTAFGIVMGGAGAGIVLSGYLIPPLLHASSHLGYRLSWYTLSAINGLLLAPVMFTLRMKPRSTSPESEQYIKNMFPVIIKNKRLLLSVLTYLSVGLAYIIYVIYFGAYTIDEMGYTEQEAGFMWSFFGLNMIYSGLVWGAISDSRNKTDVAVLLTGLLSLSVLIIIPIPVKFLFYTSTFLFGLAFQGIITVIASIMSDEVPQNEMGRIFGLATLIHSGGQVIGTFLAGLLSDVTGTFRAPLSLSLLLFSIAGLFLFLSKRTRKE